MVLYWMVIQVSKDAWLTTINPKDLIERTFLKDLAKHGQRFCSHVVRAVLNIENSMMKDPQCMKFICKVPNSKVDMMFTYNKILDHIEKDREDIENYQGNLSQKLSDNFRICLDVNKVITHHHY
jgi:hypothetical protein